jgi:hypothetical protein
VTWQLTPMKRYDHPVLPVVPGRLDVSTLRVRLAHLHVQVLVRAV